MRRGTADPIDVVFVNAFGLHPDLRVTIEPSRTVGDLRVRRRLLLSLWTHADLMHTAYARCRARHQCE